MSSKGKAGKTKALKASASAHKSISSKAGLIFPVGRMGTALRKAKYAPRVGASAPIFMAAVVEYMVVELLELAGRAAKDVKKTRIHPKHLQKAIKQDDELQRYLGNVTIASAGVEEKIHEVLKKKSKDRKSEDFQSQTY